MFRVSRLILALLFSALAGMTPGMPTAPEEGRPLADTPSDLRDFWLRFHEAELCQGLDAVFLFRPNGMEIWCIVEDERSFDKLNEMLAPLRPNYRIAVYPTRPTVEKKSIEDHNPPPSLWNNEELRAFLSDPFISAMNAPADPAKPHPLTASQTDMVRERMIMFTDQTLDWNKRLRRYAADLPALTELASDSSLGPEPRARAFSVCAAHAQAIERLAARLNDNLSEAFPRGAKRPKSPPEAAKTDAPRVPLIESARELSNSATTAARRVFRFIHPQRHTVGLADLKEPSLLEALRGLRRMANGFAHSLPPNQ